MKTRGGAGVSHMTCLQTPFSSGTDYITPAKMCSELRPLRERKWCCNIRFHSLSGGGRQCCGGHIAEEKFAVQSQQNGDDGRDDDEGKRN